jgi:hypothetical protein
MTVNRHRQVGEVTLQLPDAGIIQRRDLAVLFRAQTGEARMQLEHMDGVMVGREAYQNPGILASVDREIFGVAGAGI